MKTVKSKISANQIDWDLEYEIMKVEDALKMTLFISKRLAGATGKILSIFDGKVNSLKELGDMDVNKIDFSKLSDAIFDIVNDLNDDDLLEKMKCLIGSVKVGNSEYLDFDHAMFQNGNFGLVFKIAKKAMEVNFSDFLQENFKPLLEILQKIRLPQNGQSELQSQT